MSNIAKSFVELIGKTPLLAATRFGKKYGADANIFAKLEYFNPGGSVKDRMGQPWGPRIVALLAGIDYLIAATALTHNGRRMRMVGWVTISLSIAIPIICGLRRSA